MDDLFNPYEGLWDEIEEPEVEDFMVSEPLKQVGRDHAPTHPKPEGLDRRSAWLWEKIWGFGEPVVTPRLRESLEPWELEFYAGALNKKLRHYAWSRIDSYGSAIVDAEGLVQDALVARWLDPRELEPQDIERYAINQIKQRSMDATRELKRRTSGPKDEYDPKFYDEAGETKPWYSNPYMAPEPIARVLPEDVRLWIEDRLSKNTAEAVRLVMEEQYTQAEAAEQVGIKRLAVTRGLGKLRKELNIVT